jgi:hypothetical protein
VFVGAGVELGSRVSVRDEGRNGVEFPARLLHAVWKDKLIKTTTVKTNCSPN